MNSKLFTGTLDLLILDLLGRGDSYGFEITQMVLSRSGGRFELKEGSLYPALHRLERQKLIKGYWQQMNAGGENGNPGGRRRKYYGLTAKGRAAHEAKRDEWDEFVHAVSGVLGANARALCAHAARLAAEPASRGTHQCHPGANHALA